MKVLRADGFTNEMLHESGTVVFMVPGEISFLDTCKLFNADPTDPRYVVVLPEADFSALNGLPDTTVWTTIAPVSHAQVEYGQQRFGFSQTLSQAFSYINHERVPPVFAGRPERQL